MTLRERFPEILKIASPVLGALGKEQPAAQLLASIQCGGTIDATCFAASSPYWSDYIAKAEGQQWSSLPFFEVEFLFYHGLNSISGFYESGADVFEHSRKVALEEALSDFSKAYESLIKESSGLLRELLRAAVVGNQSDLSQLGSARWQTLHHQALLCDDSAQLSNRLETVSGFVHLVADNAGAELLWDLALADEILGTGAGQVILHLKPCPMFVSDAVVADVEASIAALSCHESDVLALLGRRLRRALDDRRFELRAEAEWGEPRSFNELGDDILKLFSAAATVIFKGDLNYRRLIEDRSWKETTSLQLASLCIDFNIFAARVLKSDAVIGIAEDRASELWAQDQNWRTNGKYALIQQMGGFNTRIWRRAAVVGSYRSAETGDFDFRGGSTEFMQLSAGIGAQLADKKFGFSIVWSEKNRESLLGKKPGGHPFWETADYHALRGFLSIPKSLGIGAVEIAISGSADLESVDPFPVDGVPEGVDTVDLRPLLASGVAKKVKRGEALLRSSLLREQAERVQLFIVLGGGKATGAAVDRAHMRGVLIPIPLFGGAGAEMFDRSPERYRQKWHLLHGQASNTNLPKAIISQLDLLLDAQASHPTDMLPKFYNVHAPEARIFPWTRHIDTESFVYNGEKLDNDAESFAKRCLEAYGVSVLRLRSAARAEKLPPDDREDQGDDLSREVCRWFGGSLRRDQSGTDSPYKIIQSKYEADQYAGNTPEDLMPHSDGTHTYLPPPIIVLQYFIMADAGGELKIIDMAQVLKRFVLEYPKTSQSMLMSLEAPFSVQVSKLLPNGSVDVYAGPCIFDGHDGTKGIRGRFDSQVKPSAQAEQAFLALRDMTMRTEPCRLAVREHDIVILDNWRVLHGRYSYTPPAETRKHRRVWISMVEEQFRRNFMTGLRPARWSLSLT
jgi:hypothetical protein